MNELHVAGRQFWFNSRHLIASERLLRLYQRRPDKHPANPVLVADRPWEGNLLQLFTAVERDPASGRWQMWYEGHPSEVLLCTAFSDDGVRWEKPDLGVERWRDDTHNNIVLQTGYWDAHQAAVVRAPNERDPARRYKLYYWVGPEWYRADNPVVAAVGDKVRDYKRNGWYVAFSEDGVRWRPQLDEPVLAGQVNPSAKADEEEIAIGDFNTVIFDEQRGRYRSYHKLDKRRPGWDMSRRCMGLAESDDGVRFEPSRSVIDPDDADDAWARANGGIRAEFYGLHAWPHAGFYLGMLWMFVVTKTGEPPYGRGWDDGPIAPHLIFSADGITWERLPVREPFIPLGPAGSFEAGMVFSGDRPVTVGDAVFFHYHGCSYTHGFTEPINSPNMYTGVGLATLPRDRYVGWQAGATAGALETHPLRFSGRELRLNVDAARGRVRAALLEPSGAPIPGFSLEDCDPITDDSLHAAVTWRGVGPVALAGRPVRLHLELQLSTLYTWEFLQ
ncbi:MAG: hypothetical protein RLZZ387_696 [Chloroflexota bacterium]|jgi:hypothetical protein